jgi:hypothetical protein
MAWVTDLSANRFNNTYFRDAHGTGFAVDMSGDLVVRGNVGIPVDSPYSGLTIHRADMKMVFGSESVDSTNSGSIQVYRQVSGETPTASSSIYNLCLNPYGGNVGIGTSSPKSALQVNNDSGVTISPESASGVRTAVLRLGQPYEANHDAYCAKITSTNNHSANHASDLRFYTSTGNNANANERMCILSTGYVGIGTNSPDFALDVEGGTDQYSANTRYFNSGRSSLASVGGTIHNISIRASQSIYTVSGSIVASDSRIKTNVTEINDASSLDKIRLLKPSYYNYIDTTDRTSSVVEGFIAQEVKEVLPYAVSTLTSYIPNIFKIGSYNEVDNIITIDNYDTNALEYDASNNLFKKIKLYDISNNKY